MLVQGTNNTMKLIYHAPEHDSSCFAMDEDGNFVGIEEERLTRKRHAPWIKNSLSQKWVEKRISKFSLLPRYYDHHLFHATSGYYTSPFDDASILVVDGFGVNNKHEKFSISIYKAENNNIELVKNYDNTYSLGMLYEWACNMYGFSVHSEGKFMGFASYGKRKTLPKLFEHFDITGELSDISTVSKQLHQGKYDFNFSFADRAAEIQQLFEHYYRHLCYWIKTNLPSRNLILTGGCALNAMANMRIVHEKMFKNIFIPTLCNDGGIALGNLLYYFRKKIKVKYNKQTYDTPQNTKIIDPKEIKNLLADKVIAWFEGGSEYGPRALCHRSLLADPGNKRIAYRLNEIKSREYWRPLAPVVLDTYYSKLFDSDRYLDIHTCMQATEYIRKGQRELYPAICAVDGTSRPQVLERDGSSDVLYDLMEKFDLPVLVNTSMNGRGEAICETPRQAINFCQKFDDVELVFVKDGQINLWTGEPDD